MADALGRPRGLHAVFLALRQQPCAGHARIQLDVHIHRDARRPRGRVKLIGGGFVHHRLRDGVGCKQRRIFGARVPQNKHGPGDAAGAQIQRLLQAGYGECIRAMALKEAAAAHGAMAIRIRFDHAHDFFAGAPCDVKIVQQCIAIDFRPGAGGWRKRFHSASLKSLGISPYFQQYIIAL